MLLMRSFTQRNLIVTLLSIAFSYFFVYIINWDEFKNFQDIERYINRIYYLLDGGTEREFSGISFLSSELLWKFLLLNLATLEIFDGNYRLFISFISFISLFIYSHFSLKRVSPIIYMLLVFNPLFMHLIIEQVRIALAFSLLLLVYENRHIKLIYILVVASVLIHTASLLLIIIFFIIQLLIKYISKERLYEFVFITPIILAFILKYGSVYIFGFLEDRRLNYTGDSSSILFSLFWFFLALIFVMNCKRNNTELMRIVSYSIFMMVLFFGSSLIDNYGQRYIALAIPLVIISTRGIINYRVRFISIFLIVIYNLVSWFYWFKLFDFI